MQTLLSPRCWQPFSSHLFVSFPLTYNNNTYNETTQRTIHFFPSLSFCHLQCRRCMRNIRSIFEDLFFFMSSDDTFLLFVRDTKTNKQRQQQQTNKCIDWNTDIRLTYRCRQRNPFYLSSFFFCQLERFLTLDDTKSRIGIMLAISR